MKNDENFLSSVGRDLWSYGGLKVRESQVASDLSNYMAVGLWCCGCRAGPSSW